MKNITFTADDKLIEKARLKATLESTTLNNRFREWLEKYVAESDKINEFHKVMGRINYVEAGQNYSRDEMNERNNLFHI